MHIDVSIYLFIYIIIILWFRNAYDRVCVKLKCDRYV